jgi:hypothetical protein
VNKTPLETEKTVEVDKAKKRIYIRFEGFLSLEQAKQLCESYRKGIAEVGRGYTVLSYFKNFKPGTDEIQDVISDMIQMASAAGCRRAARVGGGSILGPLQLRRLSTAKATYEHDYFDTWEEAEAYLDAG